MPILELTSRECSGLRSAAHALRPIVLIGGNGLTEAVLKEIDCALTAHGLIKLRVAEDDRKLRGAMLTTLCEILSCAPVQHLGKTLIVFRPLPTVGAPGVADSGRPKQRVKEGYTPKKAAALGKTLGKQPSRKLTPTLSRRKGSALSLRVGARKSMQRLSSGKR
jgi:RNA-binding protein